MNKKIIFLIFLSVYLTIIPYAEWSLTIHLFDSITDEIAMDCEMVGVSSQGHKSALGRVTLVLTSHVLFTLTFLFSNPSLAFT